MTPPALDEAPAAPAARVGGRSRLLRRLDDCIETASSPQTADALRCERAGVLARSGAAEAEAAERAYAELRDRHAAGASSPALKLSIRLHLAEGLIARSTGATVLAHDRLARAHALSAAASIAPLRAVCAAWLAQVELERRNAPAAARFTAEALQLASPDRPAALARAMLVAAQGYHEAGRDDEARRWYVGARRHAAAEGDDATLGDLLRGMARDRFAAWRQARCLDPAASSTRFGTPDAAVVLRCAESSAHFDAVFGLAGPAWRPPMLRAQILTESGSCEEALGLFEAHLPAALADPTAADMHGLLHADRAWCLLDAVGESDAARTGAEEAAARLSTPGAAAARAPGHTRLAAVYDRLGDAPGAAVQHVHATRAWARHQADQKATVEAFDVALTGIVTV